MPFVSEWIGFTRNKHPSWTSPSAISDGHGLVQTSYPGALENLLHMTVPLSNQLAHLPEPILEARLLAIGILEGIKNLVESVGSHPTVQSVRCARTTVDFN